MYLSNILIAVCIVLAYTPKTYVSNPCPPLQSVTVADECSLTGSCACNFVSVNCAESANVGLELAGAPPHCQAVAHADTLDVAVVVSMSNKATSASAPVRTVTSSGIVRSGARNLDEVLRTFAGISVKDYGGIGGLKTVSVRGFGSQHTAVSYDGIPVSDAVGGQVDISRFNLDNVSRIAVSIGGTDDIFRSARHLTSAGILEINSAKADFVQGPVQIDARICAGSFGTYSPYLLYRQRIAGGWSLSASANGLLSEGNYPFVLRNGDLVTEERRYNSDVASLNTEIKLSGDMGAGGALDVRASFAGSARGLPGYVILYADNPLERLWERSLMANAVYTNNIGRTWKVRAGIGYSRAYNRYVDTDAAFAAPQDDRYTQQEYSLSAIVRYSLPNGFRLVLAEDAFANSLASNIPECPFPLRITSMTALSAQYSGGERITATAGLVGTFSHETVRSGQTAPDRQRLSPFASLSYKILKTEELRVRISFKDGFRMPTFNDLYYSRVGNAGLVPERALQTNLGLTWSRNFRPASLSLTADVYYNKIKDKIVAIPTMFIWKMRNVGEVQMAGADVTGSFRCPLADWLVLDVAAGYSFLYAADVTDPKAKNYRHQIPYTPKHTGNLNLCVETPWANVSYILSGVGERFALAQNLPINRIAPYTDHGLSVNRKFEIGRKHKWGLYAGAELMNIGNLNYEIIRYYPMPGRNFRVTVKVTY